MDITRLRLASYSARLKLRDAVDSFRTGVLGSDPVPREQQERRLHGRRDIATQIHLTEIDEGNAPVREFAAAVLNVSKKGMCVLTDDPIPTGRSVMLDVPSRGDAPGRSILAQVTRLQRASGKCGFVVGLRTESM